MSTKIIGSSPPPFLTNPKHLVRDSGALLRLVQLDGVMPKDPAERERVRLQLLEHCEKVHKTTLTSLAAAKQEWKEGLSEGISTVYGQYFEGTTDDSSMFLAKVNQVYRDAMAVILPPVKKSVRGHEGPTLLISYPRFDNTNTETQENKRSVVKWTSDAEIWSHRVYGYVNELLQSEFFLLPSAASLDFKKKVSTGLHGEPNSLDVRHWSTLKDVFTRIKHSFVNPNEFADRKIMIFERIDGANLCDFALSRFKDLSESQVRELFRSFGRIAMIDLLMGNNDRFLGFEADYYTNEFSLTPYGANYGNVMIQWGAEKNATPKVYAIDNGIDSQIATNEEMREKFVNFLNDLLLADDLYDQLATNMLESFINSSNVLGSDDESLPENWVLLLEPFIAALKGFGSECFVEGLKEATVELQAITLPEPANSTLEPTKTGFLKFVRNASERIDLVKKVKKLNGVNNE